MLEELRDGESQWLDALLIGGRIDRGVGEPRLYKADGKVVSHKDLSIIRIDYPVIAIAIRIRAHSREPGIAGRFKTRGRATQTKIPTSRTYIIGALINRGEYPVTITEIIDARGITGPIAALTLSRGIGETLGLIEEYRDRS